MSKNKLTLIQNEINDTRDNVQNNISLIIDRGEKLDTLVDKSDNLNINSKIFNKQAKRLKRKMLIKNLKMTALLLFIIFLIIMIILFAACGMRLQCGK